LGSFAPIALVVLCSLGSFVTFLAIREHAAAILAWLGSFVADHALMTLPFWRHWVRSRDFARRATPS
jgi:hypothetical protein